jgi:hypothetical protein
MWATTSINCSLTIMSVVMAWIRATKPRSATSAQ